MELQNLVNSGHWVRNISIQKKTAACVVKVVMEVWQTKKTSVVVILICFPLMKMPRTTKTHGNIAITIVMELAFLGTVGLIPIIAMSGTPCEKVERLTLHFIYILEIELRPSNVALIIFQNLGFVLL